MPGSNIARTGLLLVAISFPLYLLWKGRLPLYIGMTKGSAK
jgi:hypothetical protein